MFLYSWLHLSGHHLPMEEIKKFRQLRSMTPGHPEFPSSQHHTPGVEATTGPLGAGVGNAVGMAAAAKHAAARYNTDTHTIIDHHVIALCGDGCLQEGVAFEAAAFAGHEGLDNLILIFDSNDVTLDKMASFTQSEDHGKRFEALGMTVPAAAQNTPANLKTYMAEETARHFLSHKSFTDRSFEVLKKHLGGFDDDELRKILVRAGAIRVTSRRQSRPPPAGSRPA